MDDALQEMGGFGRHQVKIWFIQSMCYWMGNYAFYPMGFYELQPQYQCLIKNDDGTEQWDACLNTDFCPNLNSNLSNQNQIKYRIDYTDQRSLYNWV